MVHVGGEDYIHISVFKGLSCYGGTLRFSGVQEGKTLNDPIEDIARIGYSSDQDSSVPSLTASSSGWGQAPIKTPVARTIKAQV